MSTVINSSHVLPLISSETDALVRKVFKSTFSPFEQLLYEKGPKPFMLTREQH